MQVVARFVVMVTLDLLSVQRLPDNTIEHTDSYSWAKAASIVSSIKVETNKQVNVILI